MDCIASCGKTIIVLINTLFGLIALACLVIGLIIRFGKDILSDVLEKVLEQIKDQIKPMLTAIGKSEEDFMKNFDLNDLFGQIAIVLIVFGAVLLALVIIGYCGACCKSRWMLILYSIILIVILLAQIVGMVLIFAKRDVVDTEIKKPLTSSLVKYYEGDQGTSAVTVAWNAIMLQMSCCGVSNYKDFDQTMNKWTKTYTITNPSKTISNLKTPFVCCNEKGRDKVTSGTHSGDCATDPEHNEGLTNYKYGCYDAIWDEIEKFKPTVIGVVCGIGVFQLLLIFFSIWLAHAIKKENTVSPI